MEKKKIFTSYRMKFIGFYGILLVLLGLIVLLNAHTYRLPIFDGTGCYIEPKWYFGEKNTNMETISLDDQRVFEPGKTYVLSTFLTYTGEGDTYPCAFITAGNYEVRVYLDGDLMFEYTKEQRGFPRLKGMGGAAVSIPLGKYCEGQELLLELETPMDYSSLRRMPGVLMGDHSNQMENLFLTNVPSMIISCAISFVVIVLVMLGNPNEDKRWAYIHFSMFALTIVAYRAMQDLFVLYIWANPVMAILVEFVSLVLCPIPILLSYYYELRPHFQKTLGTMVILSIVHLAAQLILHFTGIRDVVEMMSFTHFWILLCALTVVTVAIRARKIDSSIHCLWKLIPILAGACLDFLVFYIRVYTIGPGSFFTVGNFIGLGLLVSLVLMVWEARKEREISFAQKERSQLLEKMAYEDALTGIENRAAFTRELEQIQSGARPYRSILVVAADLNGLKITNDTLGHSAGDTLICRAADLLCDSFREYGHVYRTGGDEFFSILHDVTQEQWEMLYDCFRQELKKRNEAFDPQVSVAMGHAFMDDNIDLCIQLADHRMYANKAEIKSGKVSGVG